MDALSSWLGHPAAQQASYGSEPKSRRILSMIARGPALIELDDVLALGARLAEAAAGRSMILQMGDCAEPIADAYPAAVRRKTALISEVAAQLTRITGKPVIPIGRIGGQYAKPRSQAIETRDGISLPVFRGESINGHDFSASSRVANPLRMLSAYLAAKRTHEILRAQATAVFTSHEALHLGFEDALSRSDDRCGRYNGAGHLVWIGARTNHSDHAHVHYCAALANPIAVKIAPGASPGQICAIYRRLNPLSQRGRLTFISRMGRGVVSAHLPPLLAALEAIGAEVLWMCDPMHGNTFTAPSGVKTRAMADLREELDETIAVLGAYGRRLDGVHLETSPDDVAECVSSRDAKRELADLGPLFRSKCDPRLNCEQTLQLCGWLAERLAASAGVAR